MNTILSARARASLLILLLSVVAGACASQTTSPAPATSASPVASAASGSPGPGASAASYASWKPAGMTDAQAAKVVQLSIDALLKLGIAAGYEDGYVVTLTGVRAYLGNLALSLLEQPEDRWPDLIADHFKKAFDQPAASGDPVPANWDEAKLHVRVVVRAGPYFAADAVTRALGGDLVEGIVYDKPSAFVVVPREFFNRWGVSEDDAFATGLANTLSDPTVKLDRDESDAVLSALNSPYASTFVLAIDRLLTKPSPNGCLVGVPTRSKIIVVPIRNATINDAISQYPETIGKDYKAGPYPVSPLLYWWYQGKLYPISDDAGALLVPDALQRILNELP